MGAVTRQFDSSVDKPRITAAQFEREYAERSGVTVEWLRAHGRVVRRCRCGEEGCEGWQSVARDDGPAR